MMDEPQIDVARVLPHGGPGTLTADEVDAILEVAYLATQADGDLDEEETEAFRELAGAIAPLAGAAGGAPREGAGAPSGAPLGEGALDALLDRFASHLEHATIEERLGVVAKMLARPLAHETAYKVAFAMALCDLADNDDEDDFDDALVAALRLSEDKADELAAQVYEAIGGDDEEGGP